MIFDIEGNIGAGKSTLAHSFVAVLKEQGHRVVHLTEPVEEWRNYQGQNLLDIFYEDQRRWSFTFQVEALLSMTKRENTAMDFEKHGFIVVKERSSFSVRKLFTPALSHLMTPVEKAVMEKLIKKFEDTCMTNNSTYNATTVYLRADPETCLQRINKRGRKEETDMQLTYLQQLHTLHEQEVPKLQTDPSRLIVIDGNLDYCAYEIGNPGFVKVYGRDECFFDIVKKLLAKEKQAAEIGDNCTEFYL